MCFDVQGLDRTGAHLILHLISVDGRCPSTLIYRRVTHIQRKAGTGLNAIPLQCVLRWGAFCWRGLASRFFLQGRATANTHKLVLSDHFDLMMKHFYSDLMGVVSSRMTMHPSEGLQFGFGWITISVGGWFEISVLWPKL